jgi:hypothetical protein
LYGWRTERVFRGAARRRGGSGGEETFNVLDMALSDQLTKLAARATEAEDCAAAKEKARADGQVGRSRVVRLGAVGGA